MFFPLKKTAVALLVGALASSAYAVSPTYSYRLFAKGLMATTPVVAPLHTYATMDSLGAGATSSNSGLTVVTSPSGYAGAASSLGKSTGKWYWEAKIDSARSTFSQPTSLGIGIASSVASGIDSRGIFALANCIALYSGDGRLYVSGGMTTMYSPFGVGTVIGLALDMDGKKLYLYINGALVTTVPVTATTAFPAISDGYVPDNDTVTFNFGASAFKYSVPTGFNSGLYH